MGTATPIGRYSTRQRLNVQHSFVSRLASKITPRHSPCRRLIKAIDNIRASLERGNVEHSFRLLADTGALESESKANRGNRMRDAQLQVAMNTLIQPAAATTNGDQAPAVTAETAKPNGIEE